MELEWKKYADENIESVVGDEWAGGNLAYHLKPRPKWYDVSKNTLTFVMIQHSLCVNDRYHVSFILSSQCYPI